MLTALLVMGLVIVGLVGARSSDLVIGFWAAGPLAAAMWLRTRSNILTDFSFAMLIAVGIFAGEFLIGQSLPVSLMFTGVCVLEVICAVALARRFTPEIGFDTVRRTLRFLLGVALLAPLPSAALAAGGAYLLQDFSPLSTFRTWWFGHALGFAVVTPFVLEGLRATGRFRARLGALIELVGLLAVFTAVCVFTYLWVDLPLAFLPLPLLIWITVRFRFVGVAAGLTILSVLAIVGAAQDVGPFSGYGLAVADRVLIAQASILLGALPLLLLAAQLETHSVLAHAARAREAQAERASQAKSRLLANVAHEIKSPMGGIIGIGEMWTDGRLGPVTSDQQEMAALMVRTAREVETLSHDLLDMAQAEGGDIQVDLRPVNVAGVLEDARVWAVRNEDHGDVRFDIQVEDPETLTVRADSQRLAQVINHLISNAMRYGRAGGVVILTARRDGARVHIQVADHGPGVAAERRPHLFEPFNRPGLERSALEGHGIGLALSRRLVERMNGTIALVSDVTQGATFRIDLPAA